MPIDIDSETIIGLFEVGKYCPGPRKPSRATVFRWVVNGLRINGTDERVRLPSVKLNGIRCTSIESVRKFLRAANGQSEKPSSTITTFQYHEQNNTEPPISAIPQIKRCNVNKHTSSYELREVKLC